MNRHWIPLTGLAGFLLAVTWIGPVAGQDGEMPASSATKGKAKGRRNPNATREFLGLGPAPDKEAAERGAKIYAAGCGFCHGANAGGAEGPNLVRSELVLKDVYEKGALLGPFLKKGAGRMPAFPNLTKEEVYDLSQFLSARVEAVANRGTYQRLNVVTGDAKAGESYFNTTGGCAKCHSVTGDLAKIGSRISNSDQLQTRILYPGGGARTATVTLANGEKYTGTVKTVDDFRISIIGSDGRYRSFERKPGVQVDMPDPLAAHIELGYKYSDADLHNLTAYLVTIK